MSAATYFCFFMECCSGHEQLHLVHGAVQVEEEEGVKFTAFNLKEERETGWVWARKLF